MKILLTVLGGITLLFVLALLFALPTMWVVNYLFSAQLLIFVFGVEKIGFWTALVLNIFFNIAFKSYSVSSKD